MATRYAEYFPRFVKHGIKIGLLNEALRQYDLQKLGAALKPERDLQFGYLGLQTLYDRYFLVDQYAVHGKAGRRFELPQMLLHARRDGPRAERGRPRSARDRVLQRAVDVRLHELDADAVQLGHAPLAAVVVLPDDGRPTISTASTRRSRRTRCCRSSRAASATTGPTCARWARTSRAPTASRRASCRSSRWSTTRRSPSTSASRPTRWCTPHAACSRSATCRPGDLVLGQSGVYREVLERYVYNQHGSDGRDRRQALGRADRSDRRASVLGAPRRAGRASVGSAR